MALPIEQRLRVEAQKSVARLQDKIAAALYNVNLDIVLHGGTAIWRCYGGNRFSEDVDIYATAYQLRDIHYHLDRELRRYQAKLDYPARSGGRMIVSDDTAKTKLEAMDKPRALKAVSREYEMADGTKFAVRTLSAEDFMMEKMNTYEKRRYIRDIYDLYFLAGFTEIKGKVRKRLIRFLSNLDRPLNESLLKDVVYVGAVPSFNDMVGALGDKIK